MRDRALKVEQKRADKKETAEQQELWLTLLDNDNKYTVLPDVSHLG